MNKETVEQLRERFETKYATLKYVPDIDSAELAIAKTLLDIRDILLILAEE